MCIYYFDMGTSFRLILPEKRGFRLFGKNVAMVESGYKVDLTMYHDNDNGNLLQL